MGRSRYGPRELPLRKITMDLTCKKCGSVFRAAITLPLLNAVRVACPSCEYQMVVKPRTASGMHPLPESAFDSEPPPVAPTRMPRRRLAAIADEPRPFRAFLGRQLRRLRFA